MSLRIAIVGLGGIFPGARDLDEFWSRIRDGVDGAMEIPEPRWQRQPRSLLNPTTAHPDHVYSTRACLVDDFELDLRGLDLDPDEIAHLDPMFHFALHAARDAFYDGVTDGLDRQRVGVVFGNIALPTDTASSIAQEIIGRVFAEKANLPLPATDTSPLNRYVAGLPAGLVARGLGIGGTAFTLDAACASSLYALKIACDELTSGRADAMLAGGVSRPSCLYTQMGFSQLRALSRSGRCSPFDAKGDGLVVGEGAGIFLLKRLEDAVTSGDQIHGVIQGIGLANDIGGSLLAPDSEGQVRALRAAYAEAGWQPQDVELIECHATGTPVGDAKEVTSLRELWARSGHETNHDTDMGGDEDRRARCVIGGVKSNVGHLLTAAGAAGLMKVLLSFANETLPATANYESPAPGVPLNDGPFRVLSRSEPWQRREPGTPRRAAINAFGFGGIDAHVLIEEWQPQGQVDLARPTVEPDPIAVVGIAARVGPWSNLAQLEQAWSSTEKPEPTPVDNWWGCESLLRGDSRYTTRAHSIRALEVPLGRYRIPPRELEELLPQQLLMLDVAVSAAEDAGWVGEDQRLRAGVFIGIALDMNTTNFQLRWSLPEPLRDSIMPPLTANRTMGALGGIVASRVARELRVGGPSHTISSEDTSGLHALITAVEALRRRELDQALVGAVDLATDVRAVLGASRAGHGAAVPADGAGAVVLKRLSDARRDGDTVHAVIRDFDSRSGMPGQLALSATAERIGHCGAAAGFLDFLRAVRGLSTRTHPHFDAPTYWIHDGQSGPRRSAVRTTGVAGDRVRIVLEEDASTPPQVVSNPDEEALFVVRGANESNLVANLARLEALAKQASSAPVSTLARRWSETARSGARVVSLVSGSVSQLSTLLASATLLLRDGAPLPKQHESRVFYSQAPLADAGEVAFVYPGSGNHHPRMGAELARRFPMVSESQHRANRRLKQQYRADSFWRGGEPTVTDCILGQVSVASLSTDVLAKFGVRPTASIGYSLGESASYVALGVWPDRDAMLERVESSQLFTTDLSGPHEAVKRCWQSGQSVSWTVAVVDRPAEVVRRAIQDHPRTYLLIVNTQSECVIGGDSKQLEAVARQLDTHLHALDGVMSVHCEALRPVAEDYLALHRQKTVSPEGIRFYSPTSARPLEIASESVAESITAQALHGFDFTRVIDNAYDDGVRLFIEMGPGNSCTRMIRTILDGRPHVARSVCDPRRGEFSALLRVLGLLAAEGVEVDLRRLYEGMPAMEPDPPRDVIVIAVGGGPFEMPAPEQSTETTEARSVMPGPDPVLETTLTYGQLQLDAASRAHARYLELSTRNQEQVAHAISVQMDILARMGGRRPDEVARTAVTPPWKQTPVVTGPRNRSTSTPATPAPTEVPTSLTREQCMEFAIGKIVNVLGPKFAGIDDNPTRVRLPDEPLMLVDRIVDIDAEPLSMTNGRLITEHDVGARPWYLDGGAIPTCIAVEAGQADLFLSGYLGIDHETRGLAVYRLLDAEVTFHDHLPATGKVIRYDIEIEHFFRQGETILFRFSFEGTVDGKPLLSMRNGCAGFFTQQELDAGQGIVKTRMDLARKPGVIPDDWTVLTAFDGVESYQDSQLQALRDGDLAACFGEAFRSLPLVRPKTLPKAPMNLVHRILELDPRGGRFGIGVIRGEADIHPDDWFLTCHFCDDMVMPGTLMYECCLHTLRVFLLRMGWIGDEGDVRYEPIPGVDSRLKCRGQVLDSTSKVLYEITIKELGYRPEPYAIVEALMYADGKPIVDIGNMSVQLTGTNREQMERLWQSAGAPTPRTPLFDTDRILAFAVGKPSEAFGEPYRVFDEDRVIARLPGPPYQFLDRIMSIENAAPFQLAAGGQIEAEYDVPTDAWYFESNRQQLMPFAVLLEVALQPCGWFAAYVGSALAEEDDLSFRNLGGSAVLHRPVTPASGTLTTKVLFSRVSHSGGMLIQNFDLEVRDQQGLVYKGDTYFGFFSKEALANQVGMPLEKPWRPDGATAIFPVPVEAPFPDDRFRMISDVDYLLAQGGPNGFGAIGGSTRVDPGAWFFKAHFHQDPVWPGSLGLESFLQLLEVFAVERWGSASDTQFVCTAPGTRHTWSYRGQILPTDERVRVDVAIDAIDDEARTITASGFLTVDGRIIYKMDSFTIQIR